MVRPPIDVYSLSPAEAREEAERRKLARSQGLPLGAWSDNETTNSGGTTITANLVFTKSLTRFVRLPWSLLVSDNHKHVAVAKHKLMLSTEYRAAKKAARVLIRQQLGDLPPLSGSLRMQARMYPPNRHARDIQNYAKLVCDALTGLAYVDDKMIDGAQWERMPVDVDAPRLEIFLSHSPR